MTDYSTRELSSSMGGAEIARISSGGVGSGTLSWRSRDHHPSWWNTAMQLSNSLSSSAKELTSSLASKMDQVPTALAGFTLPWQPVSSSPYKDLPKSDQQQPSAALSREKLENLPWKPDASEEEEEEERKASSELPTVPPPLGEQQQQQLLPVLPGPCPLTAADLRSLSKVGESCRRTKRMPVDTTSCTTDCNDNDDIFFSSSCAAGASLLQAGGLSSVSQRFLLGDDAQLDSLRCNSMEHLPRLENRLFAKAIRHNAVSESTTPLSHHLNTDVKHVNEASLILSEARPTHSSAQQTPLPYPPEKKKSTINTGQQGESQPETPISSRGTNFHQATIHKDDIFPGNTNKLSPIRLRKSSSSIISSEQQSQKPANSLLLFDSQHSRTLSKNPVLGGSMRVTRRDHADMQQQMGSCVTVVASSLSSSASLPTTPRGGGEASLPTTPRGRGESRASRLFRRLRFGGGKSFHGGGGAAAGGGVQVVGPRDLLLKCAKQDIPTPGVAIIKQGKKLDSKAAAVITKAGSAAVDFTALHGGQHEGTSMEIRSEGNHHMLNNNTSQTTTQGQCSGGDADSTTRRKTFVKPHQQQQRKNSHWPFNKWKWTSRSRSKVVSEETNNMSAMIVNNSSRRSSFDTSQEFFAMSETMYVDASSESFSYERVGRFSSPQVKKSLSLEHMGGFFKHRRGSSLGSNREVAVSYQSLLPKHHVRCNDDIATTISDLKKLSSANQLLETSSHHGLEVDLSSSSAACQAEENTAEVFLDCEGEFKFVKRRSLSMEEDLVVWESHTPAPPPPSLPQEQNLTIGEVAALCSSPLKFVFKCREIELFNKFLRSQKKRIISSSLHLDNNNNSDCFHIICSGAECEVSSMVSALLMAWWMENTVLVPPPVMKKTNKWHLVPVLSIPRKSMHKHKDAAWLFDACGVDARALLFSDEVELENLTKAGRVKTEDIGQDLLVTRNEVGSVCTLLGEQLQREADHLLQARYMKTLLLAGILLDTENLDFASIRDTDMATALLVGSGSLGRNGFYKQLTEVESDERVSKLVTRIYGEVPQSSRRSRGEETEADHEHSDKDSYFSSADGRHSHDQTSTSEASTSSSLDEDSPRLQTPPPALPTNISASTRSAPARFHRLPSPSGVTRSVEANAVAQIREAAAGNQSLQVSSFTHGSSQHLKSGNSSGSSNSSSPFSRLRKKLLYNA